MDGNLLLTHQNWKRIQCSRFLTSKTLQESLSCFYEIKKRVAFPMYARTAECD